MVVVARRIVLDYARRIRIFRPAPHVRHAALRRVRVDVALGEESPRLVEQHPREDGRMVEVALEHSLEARPVLAERSLACIPPPVRHIGHDEKPQFVGPVQLARNLRLDVNAVAG